MHSMTSNVSLPCRLCLPEKVPLSSFYRQEIVKNSRLQGNSRRVGKSCGHGIDGSYGVEGTVPLARLANRQERSVEKQRNSRMNM